MEINIYKVLEACIVNEDHETIQGALGVSNKRAEELESKVKEGIMTMRSEDLRPSVIGSLRHVLESANPKTFSEMFYCITTMYRRIATLETVLDKDGPIKDIIERIMGSQEGKSENEDEFGI